MPKREVLFSPSTAGEQYARTLHRGVNDPMATLREYGWQVHGHYKNTGLTAKQPDKALRLVHLHMLRVISAPILFEIEQNLTADMLLRQQGDGTIDTTGLPTHWGHVDHVLKSGRPSPPPYTPQEWELLRATSFFAQQAGRRFIAKAVNDKDGPRGRLFDTFIRHDNDCATVFRPLVGFKMHDDAHGRLLRSLMTSNFSAFWTLKHAHDHGATDNAEQLSWVASTNLGYFEPHFSLELDDKPTRTCPFSTAEERAKTGSIWSESSSLTHGPWRVQGRCSANVPLPNAAGGITTAARLRLESMQPLARQILRQGIGARATAGALVQ